jgi:hypothetical protein
MTEKPEGLPRRFDEMLSFGGDLPDRKHASFRVTGADLSPGRITAATGLTPDIAYRRGDARPNGTIAQRRGQWSIDSSPPLDKHGNHLEDHLRWLLGRLEPNAAAIRRICEEDGLVSDFYCGYFMGQANSGFEISPEILAGIASLGAILGLDIYTEMVNLELEQWVKRAAP